MGNINSYSDDPTTTDNDRFFTLAADGSTKNTPASNINKYLGPGWTIADDAWTYSSYNSGTGVGVINTNAGANTKYQVGNWVKFTQPTLGIKYARITTVSTNTITIAMNLGYVLSNEAITSPYYSVASTPFGVVSAEATGTSYGWTTSTATPNTVTYNGNRSYDLTFNSLDLTSTFSNGMRLRTTRTVAAPTRCTSLNGTTQYYSKSSPAGMTFTDDFVAGAWVKLSTYQQGNIISRWNGTSGWRMDVSASGQIEIFGYNASGSNYRGFASYQSIPLNKWVHVAVQVDMSAYTATTTTMYCMIDGVDVPIQLMQGGTNPTALIQAGNLEVGSGNGGLIPFNGKIAQAFFAPAKVTQANVKTIYSQGITAALITSLGLGSAYSFDNSINDLNTTNANNLTANGSAVATNADSPFTQDDTGTPGGSNDYAIITKKAFSTNTTLTVQVPEGCTVPTSGGVSAVVYSSNSVPYGFPSQKGRWSVISSSSASTTQSSPTVGVWYNVGSNRLTMPIGQWNVSHSVAASALGSAVAYLEWLATLSTANNTESDKRFTTSSSYINAATNEQSDFASTLEHPISLSSETNYYLNLSIQPAGSGLRVNGGVAPAQIIAYLAYL